MQKTFKGNANKGGIYRIRNIKNNKVYIGSAKCFKVRASQHRSRLKSGKHSNKHLQASWNKWGANIFLFEVLEVVEGDRLLRIQIEQKYLDNQVDWKLCFNVKKQTIQGERPWTKNPVETAKKIANALHGRKINEQHKKNISKGNKGRKVSQETRQKISAAKKDKARSEQTKKKISQKMKGKKPSQKTLLASCMSRQKTYMFLSPINKQTKVINLADFCRQNGLNNPKMNEVANGKRKQYKGWKRLPTQNEKDFK